MEGKILCLTLLVCIAWAVMALPGTHLVNRNSCYVRQIKDVITVGSVITPPGQCLQVECGNRILKYTYLICGDANNGEPNCSTIDMDLSKTFPDCCPTIKCVMKMTVR